MNSINGDVFVGEIIKKFQVDKGFKGMLKLTDDQLIGIQVDYDGKMKEYLNESVGKSVILVGCLKYPDGKQTTLPVLEVREKLNGGGVMVKRGRITKKPELAYSQDGKARTHFSIAVNRGYGDKKETFFINCTIFGNDREKNPAISLAEKAEKGQEIIVKGRLSTNKKDDKTHYNMTVTEYEYIFSGSPKPPQSGNNDHDPYAQYASMDINMIDQGNEDEEIPF